jgi:hypothetical protein
MTFNERTAAVATHGFTPRQAAFLTTVMIHSGVFVARQYTTFAHVVFGQNTRDFLSRLTERRFATAHACWRGAGRIYHVHHKGLYRAIGEPDNRHRRPTTLARALERLMVLDVVLAAPELTWLGTEREKGAHFTEGRSIAVEDLPSLVFNQSGTRTVRLFPEKLPIGLGASNDIVFVYVVADPTGRDFRAFLDSHRRLLQRLQRWTIRLAFPAGARDAQAVHFAIADDFAGPPLRNAVAEEFRWFCHARRALDEGGPTAGALDTHRYAAARRAFGASRFYAAYRAWRSAGDAVIHELLSPRLHQAWVRGEGRIEIHVLPHQYQRLAAAVATA